MVEPKGADRLVGHTFSGYRLTRVIARGGMGVVYEGVQESLDRPVAVKVLYSHLNDEAMFVERFEREARAAARLRHPNIVRILDFGADGGLLYMVMDLVDGESLRERLTRIHGEGLTLRTGTIMSIVQKVGGALAFAHQLGYVHRDVKPGNILLAKDGQVFLSDFGVVKIVGNNQLTVAGAIIGTPEYMSPEQSSGELDIGPAADQYALAVVAYEMLVGRAPFQAPTPVAVMRMQSSEPPPPPSTLVPWFPPATESVLLRALSKAPAERFPDVQSFVDNLVAASSATPLPMAPGASPTSAGVSAPTQTSLAPPTTGGQATGAGGSAATGADAVSPAAMPLLAPAIGATAGGAPPVVPPLTDSMAGGALPPAAAQLPQPSQPPRRRLAVAAVLALLVALALVALAFARSRDSSSPTPTVGNSGVGVGSTATATTAATASVALTAVPGDASLTGATTAATPTTYSGAGPTTTPTGPAQSATVAAISPTAAPTPAGTPEILFSSHRGDVHDSEIYVMNPDGSGQRRLTESRGHSWGPRFSPDGKHFVFSSVAPGEHVNHDAAGGGLTGSGNHDIYIANADGTNITKLTYETSWDNAWSWSPDSQWITFTTDRDGNWELYKMTTTGTDVTRLTNNPAEDGWPSWTPDGKHIIFATNRDGNWEIYSMDADGSNPRRLTNRPDTYDTYPFVSPDGTEIVFSSQIEAANEGEIYVMNIDGSNVRRLTNTVALNYAPSWSPDGTKIIFASDRDGNDNIYVMNADGSDPHALTTDPGEDTTPSWGYANDASP